MRTRNHPGVFLLAALLIFAAPVAGHADDNLFRLYPEFEGGGLYSDNVPLRTRNKVGDFAGTMVAGFYLDYTSAARYASLHYDTFAQLFAHQSQFDRAGEGQFLHLTDQENISPTTKLRISEIFYRDSPTLTGIITSEQAPEFSNVSAQLLLANDQASINHFGADLSHNWGNRWSSNIFVRQTTSWNNRGSSNGPTDSSYLQMVGGETSYHFSHQFLLGAGYRYYDFRFSHRGRPGVQAHWPYAKAAWEPARNLYLTGIAGVVVSYTQGTNRQSVNPAGLGGIDYTYKRAHFKVYGGQEPELTTGLGGAGNFRYVRGELRYDFTQRLTGTAGGGYHELNGSGYDGQLVSWGFGLSDRVNKWSRVYARFVQLRRNEITGRQFLPIGTQNGREGIGNYIVVGLNVSFEALRWSWQ